MVATGTTVSGAPGTGRAGARGRCRTARRPGNAAVCAVAGGTAGHRADGPQSPVRASGAEPGRSRALTHRKDLHRDPVPVPAGPQYSARVRA
ncbi:hypothetical protein GCM10018787_33160 [Streptomyces thermodiastaticus]|nr:hypothetical protein GCM10018787_33160 [Streptomyces thermodiastaticus]